MTWRDESKGVVSPKAMTYLKSYPYIYIFTFAISYLPLYSVFVTITNKSNDFRTKKVSHSFWLTMDNAHILLKNWNVDVSPKWCKFTRLIVSTIPDKNVGLFSTNLAIIYIHTLEYDYFMEIFLFTSGNMRTRQIQTRWTKLIKLQTCRPNERTCQMNKLVEWAKPPNEWTCQMNQMIKRVKFVQRGGWLGQARLG